MRICHFEHFRYSYSNLRLLINSSTLFLYLILQSIRSIVLSYMYSRCPSHSLQKRYFYFFYLILFICHYVGHHSVCKFQNINFYYIFNLLIKHFFLSTETTKQYEKPLLSLRANILHVHCIISFYSCSK